MDEPDRAAEAAPKIGAGNQRNALSFGRFEVQPSTRQVLIDGEPAKLGARAFDLLLALIERRERVVGKDELLELVWPGLVVEENNLQVHISGLRRLLGTDVITTVPGRGYQFTVATGERPTGGARGSSHAPATSAGSTTDNLPLALPLLYGREDDLARLTDLVTRQPLVTVVGAPGLGKTALAMAVAGALRRHWSEGAWMVELANIADPAQVPRAVAQALRITLSGPGTALEQLVSVLQSQTLLLVLDNCEHLIEAAGALAESTVQRAPGLHLLATSQELLNVPGESLYQLRPLAVPKLEEVDRAGQFGAVRLFVERARAADPRFQFSSVNAAAVADICQRLDGLPLAIELAAARVRLLGTQGVRDRLGERFKVLTGGARTAMRRHQTLQAAIDWSYGLLAPDEQRVLRRLGVFVGGFSLELAQQVAGDGSDDAWVVIDALGTLVDRSLVSVEGDEPPRYRLLETTRAYALEKLADANETGRLIERHARAVERLFVQTEEERYGESGSLNMHDFLRRLAPELDNLRAAIAWAVGEAGDSRVAISLIGASSEVFRALGISQELVPLFQSLQATVDRCSDDMTVARFLIGILSLGTLGRVSSTEQLNTETRAERILRQSGSRRRLFYALYAKGWTLMTKGDNDAAIRAVAELKMLQDAAWPAWTRALSLNLHGCACMNQGRLEEGLRLLLEERDLLQDEAGEQSRRVAAIANIGAVLASMQRYEEAIAAFREVKEGLSADGVQFESGPLGYIDWMLVAVLTFLGRLDEADRTMRQAIAGWRRDGLLPAFSGVLAMLLAEQGRLDAAARLKGAAEAHAERSGIRPLAFMQLVIARAAAIVQAAALDPSDVERLEREGAEMDEARLVALCIGC